MKLLKRNDNGDPTNLLAVFSVVITIIIGVAVFYFTHNLPKWLAITAGVIYLALFELIYLGISELLHPSPKKENLPTQPEKKASPLLPLIGKTGLSVSPLRPSGFIEIDDSKYEVMSNGEFIDKGIQVTVTEVKNNKLIVNKI